MTSRTLYSVPSVLTQALYCGSVRTGESRCSWTNPTGLAKRGTYLAEAILQFLKDLSYVTIKVVAENKSNYALVQSRKSHCVLSLFTVLYDAGYH